MSDQPNLLFVFADQWRAQACGYAGDPNVQTPRLDGFAAESVNFSHAVSGCPVCSPYRASLLTGQYPLTHGMVVNDQSLRVGEFTSFADALNAAGYQTGYIGKWHIDGHGRSRFVLPERRLGFQFWRGFECTHDYNHSPYYADSDEARLWEGYDAAAQTTEACRFLREERDGRPWALFVSWGPPHNPYETAPEEFRALYRPEDLVLRPNVPPEAEAQARTDLAGYYAHCSALDSCFGRLLDELEGLGLAGDTVVVFTSDHGDMLGSHGVHRKQWPYEESIRVPFLLRGPGLAARTVVTPLDAPDVMPTLLSLCGVAIPETVEGRDWSAVARGEAPDTGHSAVLACYLPFHEWHYSRGGREYRGLCTDRYTYVRDLGGPWLLFDNEEDPYQQTNLVGEVSHGEAREALEAQLQQRLAAMGDQFETGQEIVARYGIRLNNQGDTYYEP